MEINLIPCPHCEKTGTCKQDDGKSCGSCLKAAKLKNDSDSKVVQCQTCAGIGAIEPKTSRMNARLPFMIVAIVLATFYVYAGFSANDNERFSQIFPLIGSLTTMIVTFYFSNKK
ncbi:hypothetical protein [Vibrio harveyi]|uniref:hypothetical protein n=1 Tax=Vibrio harveyi TaxID=669 RepID=UPI000688F883|nr:hypothetical protein [Vibrio harveyi]